MAKRSRKQPTRPATDRAAELYGRALELMAAGRRREAEVPLREAIASNPRYAAAHNALGILLLEQGNPQGALSSFERARELDPRDAAAFANAGNALQALGRCEEAVAAYERSLALTPDSVPARFNLGNAYRKLNRWEEARAAYARVVAAQPAWPEARLALAAALAGQDRLREAMAACRAALELRPAWAMAHVQLARLLMRQGDLAGAAECWQRAHEAAPADPQLAADWGRVLAWLGRWEEARVAIAIALSLAPDDMKIRALLAESLYRLRRHAEAAQLFAGVTEQLAAEVEQQPAVAESWQRLARSRLMSGDALGALAASERALALDASQAQWWIEHAAILMREGRRDEARQACEEAQRLDPTDEQIGYLLGIVVGASEQPVPPSMVTKMFDAYADRFDRHLLGTLFYEAPERVRQAVDRDPPPGERWRIVDVGCGTGLSGAAFADRAQRLTGIDLAPRMLEKARDRGCYERLIEGEAVAILQQEGAGEADLIVAADVLIYIGALEPFLAACGHALATAGRIAFSIERVEGDSFELQTTGRFRHSRVYVERVAAEAGFELAVCEEISVRQQNRQPVPGWACVLRRRGS